MSERLQPGRIAKRLVERSMVSDIVCQCWAAVFSRLSSRVILLDSNVPMTIERPARMMSSPWSSSSCAIGCRAARGSTSTSSRRAVRWTTA